MYRSPDQCCIFVTNIDFDNNETDSLKLYDAVLRNEVLLLQRYCSRMYWLGPFTIEKASRHSIEISPNPLWHFCTATYTGHITHFHLLYLLPQKFYDMRGQLCDMIFIPFNRLVVMSLLVCALLSVSVNSLYETVLNIVLGLLCVINTTNNLKQIARWMKGLSKRLHFYVWFSEV